MQLTVKKLKSQIENLPDDMPVFFRRVAPLCGNIEEASAAIPSQFSSFGKVYPCLIVEPFEADTEDDPRTLTEKIQDAANKRR